MSPLSTPPTRRPLTLHYAAVEKMGSKWSTLATYLFLTDFHTNSAKFLTELSEDPNNQGVKKSKKKSRKPVAGVC